MMDFLNYIDNNNQQLLKLNEEKTKFSNQLFKIHLLLSINIENNSMKVMKKN